MLAGYARLFAEKLLFSARPTSEYGYGAAAKRRRHSRINMLLLTEKHSFSANRPAEPKEGGYVLWNYFTGTAAALAL